MARQQANQIILPDKRDFDTVQYKIEAGSRYEFYPYRNVENIVIYNDRYNIDNPYRETFLSSSGMYNDMISNGYILYPSKYVGTYASTDYSLDNYLQTKTHYSGFSDGLTFSKSLCVFNPTTSTYTGLFDALTLVQYGNDYLIDGLPVRYTLGSSSYIDRSSVKILLAASSSTTGLYNAAMDWDALYTEATKYRNKFRDVYNYLLSLPYGAAYVHPYVVYIDDNPNRGESYRNTYHPAQEIGTGSYDNILYWSDTKFILPFATQNEFHVSGCSAYINYEMMSTNAKDAWKTISNYSP